MRHLWICPVWVLWFLVVTGCSSNELVQDSAESSYQVTSLDPFAGTLWCDAGDEAFVRRSMLHIRGRRPVSVVEQEVLVSYLRLLGRAAFVRQLMSGPEYVATWTEFLADILYINRIGARSNAS